MKCAFNNVILSVLQSLISQIKVLNRVICKLCPKHDFALSWSDKSCFFLQVTSEKNLHSGRDLQKTSLLGLVQCPLPTPLHSPPFFSVWVSDQLWTYLLWNWRKVLFSCLGEQCWTEQKIPYVRLASLTWPSSLTRFLWGQWETTLPPGYFFIIFPPLHKAAL